MDPTESPTEQYGLFGIWDHYNPVDDVSWHVLLEEDYHCAYVKITTIVPVCSLTWLIGFGHELWFGFAIGGDFDTNTSVSKMNGYALITVTQNGTFETTLSAGSAPIAQSQQNLECTMTIEDCKQTNVCYRPLFTNDSADFSGFVAGFNRVAWAYGSVEDGAMLYHWHNARADESDAIYLYGDAQCVDADVTTTAYATTATPSEVEPAETAEPTGEDDTVREELTDGDAESWLWMSVAIVFMALFVLAVVVLLVCLRRWRARSATRGFVHSRVNSTDAGVAGDTQMITMDAETDVLTR